jgi:putative phosphoserine phosphatase/1-acylglycerol-3-phosphate O-acyltransferase
MKAAPSIAAFFDLDGTLLPRPSLESRFVAHLLKRGEIGCADIFRWLWYSANSLLRGQQSGIAGNKTYLAGLRESVAAEWADSLAAQSVKFVEGGLQHVAWHVSQEHRIVFVSGTLAPLARAVASRLAVEIDVIATELEVTGETWTGQLAGPHVSGQQKARAVLAFAKQHALELEQSYAYGDRISDLPMLESVGHPIAVNPDSRLERTARLRGWPICEWRFISEPALERRARSLSIKEIA